ncbi:hypothetical protein [Litorilituus sediminis]|nr:hypothetical protein [Litorilituus sediminis]
MMTKNQQTPAIFAKKFTASGKFLLAWIHPKYGSAALTLRIKST